MRTRHLETAIENAAPGFRIKPKPDTLTYKPHVNRDMWTRHLEAVLGSAVPNTSSPLPVFTAMHTSGSVLAYYENVPATSQH